MAIPSFLPYYVLAGTFAAVATIILGLNRALTTAYWPAAQRSRTVATTAVILIAWLGSVLALGIAGVFQPPPGEIPTIQYAILLPILIGGLLIWRSGVVARIIDAVPQGWLVGVQLYRALGVIFLILYAKGLLPGQFAQPAGVGDILVGLFAPVIGFAYTRAPKETAGLVRAWNILGILDLVIAVGTGFLTAPSRFQLLAFDHPNVLMGVFPMVLVPTFLVPLSIVLHIASLTKLHRTEANTDRRKVATAAA
jgi:hypothetical protein